MDPGTAKLAKLAMVVVVLAVVGVTMASLLQQPTYEASTEVWVKQEQGEQQTNMTGSGEMIKTLPPSSEGVQQFIPTLIHVIDSRPVAEDATQRLSFEMSPEQLLANLTTRHVEGTNPRIAYTSPTKAPPPRKTHRSSTQSAKCLLSASPKQAAAT